MGIIEKAWDSLHSIPKADQLLMEFQDAIAAALAPVKRYFEIIEILSDIQACFMAIPKAIMQLSPDPVMDCFENLFKDLARVLSWMPPMSYVALGCSLAAYCIDMMDEIISLFVELDDILTDYITTFQEAELLGDNELISILGCAASDIKVRLIIVMDLLKFVKPANDILVNMFIRLLPNSEMVKTLKDIKEKYDDLDAYVGQAGVSIRGGDTELPDYAGYEGAPPTQHQLVPVPPLGPLLHVLNNTRNAMVF
jgi:hypothetical protein